MRVVHRLQNFWRAVLGALQACPVARIALQEEATDAVVPSLEKGKSKVGFETRLKTSGKSRVESGSEPVGEDLHNTVTPFQHGATRANTYFA